MNGDHIPEIMSFVIGLIIGFALAGIAIPAVNSAIANYNENPYNPSIFGFNLTTTPCTGWGTGGGKFEPPPTEWYSDNCPVNFSDSNMHEGMHYKEFCECYDYTKSKLLPWEKMK